MFIIVKQWETLTDYSDWYLKVNYNSPSDHTEGVHYFSIETNIPPQREQGGPINKQNNNSSYSMAREGDNYNDEYYVPIKTRLGQIIVESNCFRQAASIALGILTFQQNDLLKTSRLGSIETITNV